MIAAAYARISSEMQEDNFSISAQTRAITEYCNKNDIQIYDQYVDEGISGGSENRPAFQQMIKDAEKKLFNLILVHKYDRFARKVELSQRVKNQLRKCGVNVISITEPVENSPMGFFVSGLHELMAEYFIRNLSQETKKGHIERAKQGLHNGSVPYGYKLVNGDMVVNKDQAVIVKKIFEMYVKEGMGSTKIAQWLNDNKIPSAVNGQWAHFTVNRILRNIKYIGKIEYDKQVYSGIHEPIIDTDTFDSVNNFMKDRTWKTSYRGSNHAKFLLLGILRCGRCQKVFRLQTCFTGKRKSSLYYYVCNNAAHSDSKNRCGHYKFYSVARLEKKILEIIRYHIKQIKNGKGQFNFVDISNVLEQQHKAAKEELERSKAAYLAKVFTLEEYAEIKNKLECQLEQIALSKSKDTSQSKQLFMQKAVNAWDRFINCKAIPERKSILKEFIHNIYVDGEDVSILWND